MRYITLFRLAQELEVWFSSRQKIRLPRRQEIVKFLESKGKEVKVLGRGGFKVSYLIRASKNFVVLKVGRSQSVEKDYEEMVYARTTPLKRHTLRYYWKTEHCMLQRYALGVPEEDTIQRLKKKGRKFGIRDIRKANMGRTKIFDLTVSPRIKKDEYWKTLKAYKKNIADAVEAKI